MKIHECDVIIIGSGINGAGLYRDLCEQGVNCLILDKSDFGSGTSAAPSRQIHGGLKYLETGEFGLVAQSTLERNLLLKNAPHLVSPIKTLIPIFSWWKGIIPAIRTLFRSKTAPRSRGAILIKLGLTIYDFYGSRHRTMPKHQMLSKKRALQNVTVLNPKIVAAGIYHDAVIQSPERLILELVADGSIANPKSQAMNYTSLVSSKDGALICNDKDGEFCIKPKIVINAAGPWIDEVNLMLGQKTKFIGGTKGSHILIRNDELLKQLNSHFIYFETNGGRICLVFEYLGQVLIGSTDIPADNPDSVLCEADEIDYMLQNLRELMPEIEVSEDQITYVYSGIRPLPTSNASTPGLISRDHSSPVLEPDAARPFPIISLVGGKWTTFRGFAEEIADTVLSRLMRERKISTQTMPIGGGRDFPSGDSERQNYVFEIAQSASISTQRAEELLQRYGTNAAKIAKHKIDEYGHRTLLDSKHYSYNEIDYIARHEMVEHLLDIVMRRTELAISGTLTKADLRDISEIAGQALNWSTVRRKQEVQTAHDVLVEKHQMQL